MGDQTRNNKLIDFTGEDIDNPLIEDLKMYPPAPLHLSYDQRTFWTSLVNSLPYDWFITADLSLLETYVITYCDYHEFMKKARESGLVYENDKGDLKKNPYWDMAEKSKHYLMTLSGKIKINPKAREGDTLTKSRQQAKVIEAVAKTGRKKGLMFIPGGKT